MNRLPIIEKPRYSSHFSSEAVDHRPQILFLIGAIACIVILVIIFRLFQLTVVKGDYYRRLSDQNRIREVVIEAQRGTITDRHNTVIASNTEPDVHATTKRITSTRTYSGGDELGHLIGYIQTADSKDLEQNLCITKLTLGDKTGKKGVERIYDCELRGQNGKKLIELDARGNYVSTLSIVPPVAGTTLKLALDEVLQKVAQQSLVTDLETKEPDLNRKGAVIVSNPQNGELLALVSTPGFSPQDFSSENHQKINQYLKDKSEPLFNRATEGTYPPGSVYKLILATAALEEKKIDESTIIEDTGFIQAGANSFGNWYWLEYGKKEGDLNIIGAIRRSNDIFFYRTGEKLGALDIKRWSEMFGLGKKTNLAFEQSSGTIPSPYWKEDVLKEKWYLGDTYNLSIGQGYLLTTPLQMHMTTSVFAANGKVCDLHLLRDEQKNCKSFPISQKSLDLIHEGMKEACSPGGTGWPLFDFTVKGKKIAVGCKTGTAEAHGVGSPKPHAWFSAYAPFDNPTIQITVMVENGGQGSDVAAPIAKDVFTAYFSQLIK